MSGKMIKMLFSKIFGKKRTLYFLLNLSAFSISFYLLYHKVAYFINVFRLGLDIEFIYLFQSFLDLLFVIASLIFLGYVVIKRYKNDEKKRYFFTNKIMTTIYVFSILTYLYPVKFLEPLIYIYQNSLFILLHIIIFYPSLKKKKKEDDEKEKRFVSVDGDVNKEKIEKLEDYIWNYEKGLVDKEKLKDVVLREIPNEYENILIYLGEREERVDKKEDKEESSESNFKNKTDGVVSDV